MMPDQQRSIAIDRDRFRSEGYAVLRGFLDDALIAELIDHSYAMVASGLTRKLKAELAALGYEFPE